MRREYVILAAIAWELVEDDMIDVDESTINKIVDVASFVFGYELATGRRL